MKKKKEKTVNTGDVKKDDKKQSQKFIETAFDLDADSSGKKFNKAMKKIKPDTEF